MKFINFCAPIAASIAVILTIPLVLGYWGALHPAFDSLSHFRLHLAAVIILLALPSLFVRRWLSIALSLILLAIATTASTLANPAGTTIAYASAETAEVGSARYKLLQMNLRYDNRAPKEVLSLIGQVSPDVITLDEVSNHWLGELKFIEHAYPYRIICTSNSPVGSVAILSRRPFLHPSKAECYSRGSLAIATINFGGAAVDIAAIHLGWPWPYRQQDQLKGMEPILAQLSSSTILAGDLNATWWSQTARTISTAGDLKSLGNIGPTWLVGFAPDFLRRYAGLPIDNLFVKGRVVPTSTHRLPTTGSDHLPVLMEFGIIPEQTLPALQVRNSAYHEMKKTG